MKLPLWIFAPKSQRKAKLKVQSPPRRVPTLEMLEDRLTPTVSTFELSTLLPPNGDGTSGFVITGISVDDVTGYSVSSAGDINGDGYGDLLVGAPYADPNGQTDAGEAYVVFGAASGFASSLNLSSLNGANGFKISGSSQNDNLGGSVSKAGDINGDGFDDVVVGALGADANDVGEAGESYVIFGKAGGFAANLNASSLDGINGFMINGASVEDFAGISVSSAGDVNGDGLDDLLIGAHLADPIGQPDAGRSYVVFGKTGGFGPTLDLSSLNGTNGFTISGKDEGEQSGRSASAAGDINGDGFDDLIIGAQWADPDGKNAAGKGYVVFGKDSGFTANLDLGTLDGANGFAVEGSNPLDHLGRSVSAAGDIDGDGFGDIILGAPGADPDGRNSAGESYVVFGNVGGFAESLEVSTLNGMNGFAIKGINAGDISGIAVSAAGDVNGDGFDDLTIGASTAYSSGQSAAGQSYILYGKSGGFGTSINLSDLNGTNGFVVHGFTENEGSGFSVSSAGDVNGDGYSDIILGSNISMGQGKSGVSYVIFGRDYADNVTQQGTASSELLTGSTSVDVIVAGQGNDTLVGNGGADVLYGGQGNDTFLIIDQLFQKIDGGAGLDTLIIEGSTLDLSSPTPNHLRDIEFIDLASTAASQQLLLSTIAVGNIVGASNQLVVLRTPGVDSIEIGTGWSYGGLDQDDDTTFVVYTHGHTRLLVQHVIPAFASIASSSSNDATIDLFLTGTEQDDALYFWSMPTSPHHLYLAFTTPEEVTADFVGITGRVSIVTLGGDDLVDALATTHQAYSIDGGDGDDSIIGGSRSDSIANEVYIDIILGGAGNDWILGGAGSDSIHGDIAMPPDDYIYGQDTIFAGDGDDTVFGDGDGGEGAADLIYGGAGNDMIRGDGADGDRQGNDTIYGEDGDDLVFADGMKGDNATEGDGGEGGSDLVFGNAGHDQLFLGGGNDAANGGDGSDYIYGGDGAEGTTDSLEGGVGDDTLRGGIGADTYSDTAGNDAYMEVASGHANNVVDLDVVGGIVFNFDDGFVTLAPGHLVQTADAVSPTTVTYSASLRQEVRAGAGDNLIDGSQLFTSLTAHAGEGSDTVLGGSASDTIYGSFGNDSVDGGAGGDVIYGSDGHDYIVGKDGNDVIDGGDHQDAIFGGDGDDSIIGAAGNDSIDGGADNDTLDGGDGNDTISGASGHDTLYGSQGDDDLFGLDGNDDLYGGIGNDSLEGGVGNDYLLGELGSDIINGGDGGDILDGGAEHDIISGGDGNDVAYGQDGSDTLVGNEGEDTLYGGDGNDAVHGDAGDDFVSGGEGNDSLYGGSGSDGLLGWTGSDVYEGGTGRDRFLYQNASDLDIDYDIANDVRIRFIDNVPSPPNGFEGTPIAWTHQKIETMDKAFEALVTRTGSVDILRYFGAEISVYLAANSVDWNGINYGQVLSSVKLIGIREWNDGIEDHSRIATMIHEIGHNWDDFDEHGNYGIAGNLIGTFRQLSGWVDTDPSTSITEPMFSVNPGFSGSHYKSEDDNWWYVTSAKFVGDLVDTNGDDIGDTDYARTNPFEDWAEVLETYFEILLGWSTPSLTAGQQAKIDVIDQFLSNI